MSIEALRMRSPVRLVPVVAALLALWSGGCTLDFPIEWLSGDCGDGRVNEGEQCDDGNNIDSDGCSGLCELEAGWSCDGSPSVCFTTCGDGFVAGVEQCDDGNTTPGDGCDAECNSEVVGCGDGEIQSADGEECDDGNSTAFDGCDDQCMVEDGWDCNGAPSLCSEICGDGSTVGAEAMPGGCDDGNVVSGDGCDLLCQVEPGYICVGEPSVCETGCGDGTVAGVEQCDDGNNSSGDGCTSDCLPEDGWDCDDASPTFCAEICGDGTTVGAEAQVGGCDDGNSIAGDGCAPDCTEEPGYHCTGEPSLCDTLCGDNVVAGLEQCDDGNTTDCDGCRGDCSAIETGCGDGFVCGAETCDDGNTSWGDGCGGTCIQEAGWTCVGEPSVCTVGCTVPPALFLQGACNAGDMCTVTAFDGGSYVCVAEGSNDFYQPCTGFDTCVAGAACDNLGAGLMCLPYCDASDPTWTCPMNGSERALCAYYYPNGQTTSGICAPNECDAVAQTGCSTGWCDRIADGVAFCETADPPGTVGLHGQCVQTNPSGPSEMCQPGMLCINTGSDECLSLCRLGQSDCTVAGEFCVTWNPPDPVYGICQ